MSIYFVCTGNICRSAMAHYYAEDKASKMNIEVDVYSCGLFPDGRITRDSVRTLEKRGISGSKVHNHHASPPELEKVQKADFILCMTKYHLSNMKRLFPDYTDKMHLLLDFANKHGEEVEDPWGESSKFYMTVLDKMIPAVDNVLVVVF